MEENNGIPRLMFSEELHVHQHMREKILETMYDVSEKLASLVKDGQKAGAIRKDIDALTTVLMFVAMIQGWPSAGPWAGSRFRLAKEAAKTWKNFEKLITPEQAASAEGRMKKRLIIGAAVLLVVIAAAVVLSKERAMDGTRALSRRRETSR